MATPPPAPSTHPDHPFHRLAKKMGGRYTCNREFPKGVIFLAAGRLFPYDPDDAESAFELVILRMDGTFYSAGDFTPTSY